MKKKYICLESWMRIPIRIHNTDGAVHNLIMIQDAVVHVFKMAPCPLLQPLLSISEDLDTSADRETLLKFCFYVNIKPYPIYRISSQIIIDWY